MSSARNSPQLKVYSFKAMGSPCKIHIYVNNSGECNIAQSAIKLIHQLEAKYSRYKLDNIVAKINKGGTTVDLDDETISLLNYAHTAYQLSDGLFDITTGVLRKAWDFKQQTLPSQELIDECLSYVGWHKVLWDGAALTLPRGMQIDFGGIVKEYAADAIASYFIRHKINHGLIDLGGDIRAIGTHPNGQPWQIGVRNPVQPEQAIAKIELSGGGVATSGNYARFININGVCYGHILDPLTGWPVHGVSSVSVHADTCIVAGTASTIALLKGPCDGKQWLKDLGVEYILLVD